MKYSIFFNFKYLSMEMDWEKWILHWEKWNFDPMGNLSGYDRIFGLRKGSSG